MKYSKIFSEQELQDQRDKWTAIGLATGASDFSKAESAAKAAYKQAGLAEPRFIRTGSPEAAVKAATSLTESGEKDVYNQVSNQVSSQVYSQVWRQVSSQVWRQVYNQVYDQVSSQVWRQVYGQVYSQVYNQVFNYYYRSSQLARLTMFRDIEEVKQLDCFVSLAESTGMYLLLNKTVIFSERPDRIVFRGTGQQKKAVLIEYPDGLTVTSLSPLEQLATAAE